MDAWTWLLWIVLLGLIVLVGAIVVVFAWWWRGRATQVTPSEREEYAPTARPETFIELPRGIAPVAQASSTVADDLADIEGIGPRIHDILNETGIRTFAQLADTPVERLREIIVSAELKLPVHPESWPAQARLAATGQWAELKALQDSLKAGV